MLMKRGGEGLNSGGEVKGILHWLEGSLNFLFISIFEGVVNGIGLRLVLGSARCFYRLFLFLEDGKTSEKSEVFLRIQIAKRDKNPAEISVQSRLRFTKTFGNLAVKKTNTYSLLPTRRSLLDFISIRLLCQFVVKRVLTYNH